MARKLAPWTLLKEPKFVSAMLATAYALASINGIVIMLAPAGDLVTEDGIPLAFVVGGIFVLGGIFGAISLHGGEWWLERAGIWMLIGAFVGYILTILGFEGSLTEKTVRTLFTLFIMTHLAARLYKIRGLTLDPTK